ncbi:DUF1398 family protein [Chitinophaga pollutisoli]|uniref:DUF1398 family protein n=1 Tax=Chitinophaga pollutisoli TaxID=3133966 RepID=A0ABZ2YKX1_9BACT
MFTIDQIEEAHGKVQSGADFPAYIRELAQLGVKRYETFVSDGHTDYYGPHDEKSDTHASHTPLEVAHTADVAGFNEALKVHQQGGTSYPEFLADCAKHGVEKWEVKVDEGTCTYYDKTGRVVLEESIPPAE